MAKPNTPTAVVRKISTLTLGPPDDDDDCLVTTTGPSSTSDVTSGVTSGVTSDDTSGVTSGVTSDDLLFINAARSPICDLRSDNVSSLSDCFLFFAARTVAIVADLDSATGCTSGAASSDMCFVF